MTKRCGQNALFSGEAKVDKLKAEIAKLTQDVADFTTAISELDKSI